MADLTNSLMQVSYVLTVQEVGRQMIELNDLLAKGGIEPDTVLAVRHSPKEPALRKRLPWLAAEKHKIFNAYQQTQTPRVERAMQRVAYIASFIGHTPGKAVFVGLYKRGKWHPLGYEDYWRVPEYKELRGFGLEGYTERATRENVLWFDLELTKFSSEWKGRLVVDWPPPPLAWARMAHKNRFPVFCIHPETILVEDLRSWDEMCFTWADLKILPAKWRASLRDTRAIYFILDERDGKGYVGSAYGSQNLLGRWENYAARGDGGNVKLRDRDPTGFRFSILQRLSPDMVRDEVIQLESSWKTRLHTREFGLNIN